MKLGTLCTVDIICCSRDATVRDAAALMRKHHVGDVIVVDDPAGARIPLGIVTDRDIVVSIVAPGLDPASLRAGDIMSEDLLLANEGDAVDATIERMRQRGIRRVPVVDDDGRLAGVVSADDLLGWLAEEVEALARIAPHQQSHERQARQ